MVNNNSSRRTFLAGISKAAGAITLGPIAGAWAAVHKDEEFHEAQPPGIESLKDLAARKGILYGAATEHGKLSGDAAFAALFAQQCDLLVPEGELKWNTLRPTPGSFNFGPSDELYAFTQQHQMKYRGHTLMWHEALPKWFAGYATKANAQSLLTEHISKVVGHYAGKMQSWDVINETLLPEDHRSDGLRNSPWLELLGPGYTETALRAAAQADPSAMLVWNETWIEEDTSLAESKRQSFLQHLRDLQQRNVPLHGIGIQSHLMGDHKNIGGANFQRFLHEVSEMNLKILITEMDIRDFKLPAETAERDRIVGDKYSQYLSSVLQHKSVIAVLTWGLSDRYTWIAKANPRSDGAAVRPLPFDENLAPTPAFYAIAKAFEETPRR